MHTGSGGAPYIAMKFSETEHLIAVAGLPRYELEIWNWRTSKLLAVEQTDIHVDNQILRYTLFYTVNFRAIDPNFGYVMWIMFGNSRVSHSFPLTITQYSPETGNINFWEVYISVDTAKLIKRKIKCPLQDATGPYQICYGIDGCIFFMNNKCEVYQV